MIEEKSLKEQAKELGIKYNGVPREELAKKIEEARLGKSRLESTKPDVNAEPEVNGEVESDVEVKKTKKVYNCVVVYNKNGNELRRYTKDTHGANFAELAEQFVSKNNEYTMVSRVLEEGIVCPSCGHAFHLDRN